MKKVYVISKEGPPLMPCSPCKAKKLLKAHKAKVIQLYPFTIQLVFEVENGVQEMTLGIDTGFQNIGFSCITAQNECASGTLVLEGKTSERLTEKAMYRRGRRNKLWYRKPRFRNRKRRKGWLPPSIQRRYDAHLKLIHQMKALMPISSVIIEVAHFDIQKIENPTIGGVGYQKGDLYDYQNRRSYLMAREKGCCQLCKKAFGKGNGSHIHHIMERANGGTDRVKNLAILHKKCHERLHQKGLKLSSNKTYKESIYMSNIRNKFWNDVKNLKVTYGYKTFVDRIALGLEKTHYTDAFVIAGGSTQERLTPIVIQQKRRNNRTLQLNRKGFAPSIRKRRYNIQPKDLVWIDGKKEIATGVHNHGTRVIIERTKKSIALKKVEKTYHWGSFCYL
jgi:RRXRR protein/HNH endonuclease